MNGKERHILLVPNEDGFGPSAFGYYIASALLQAAPDFSITVWNRSRFAYNKALYKKSIATGRVTVEPVWNLIQLQKEDGFVSIPQTLTTIGDYRSASDRYPTDAVRRDFDLVVEIGVPAAARWAEENEIPCIGVFDHCWSKTLDMMLSDAASSGIAPVSDKEREAWQRLVVQIQRDEASAGSLFLFPRFITPDPYYRHWKNTAKAQPFELGGVLGGHVGLTRSAAQQRFGLKPGEVNILIQGGDTPAWDSLLKKLIPALRAQGQSELEKRKITLLIYVPHRLQHTLTSQRALHPRLTNVRIFDTLPNGTLQNILPAVDLIVTRAGGGTVNDAVACQTPFVCVRETGHSQVEAILDACLKDGLTRSIELADLLDDPLHAVLGQLDRVTENERIVRNMSSIRPGREARVVQAIIDLCQ
ncbi:MAG: glycosyltransferase [Myxococcota bacterium]|nr:glycosyltransferase [Myxococcota bacterium]